MSKVALVTGGNFGIGKAVALLFAQCRYWAAIAARGLARLEAVQQEIEQAGDKAMAIAADVSKPEDVQQMVQAVIAQWQQSDVLISAAGTAYEGTILDTDEKFWDETLWPFGSECCLCSGLRQPRRRQKPLTFLPMSGLKPTVVY